MTSTRIRLFYSIPEYFPPWRLDVSHLFGEQLTHKGFDITWSTWRDKPGLCRTELWHGQNVLLPASLGRKRSSTRLISRLLHTICEIPCFFRLITGKPFDFIQARDLRYLAAFMGWLVARLQGTKFTYWLSYPFPEHYLEWSRNSHGFARLIRGAQGAASFWFVYKWLMHRADHIFVQSEQMKQDVASYGVSIDKMTSVPMGVPPSLLNWIDHNPTDIVPGRIVYVGTMASVRKLETLIESFAMVASKNLIATLVMVGDGDLPSERIFAIWGSGSCSIHRICPDGGSLAFSGFSASVRLTLFSNFCTAFDLTNKT